MGFLEFAGGVVVFGLLWVLLPRAAMSVLLMSYLTAVRPTFGQDGGWEAMTMSPLLMGGVLIGLVIDIAERCNSWKTRLG